MANILINKSVIENKGPEYIEKAKLCAIQEQPKAFIFNNQSECFKELFPTNDNNFKKLNNNQIGNVTETYEPVPIEEWPEWVLAIYSLRQPGDKGIGDTIKRLAGKTGEAYQKLWKAVKWPCRCPERQAKMNQKYLYPEEDLPTVDSNQSSPEQSN